MTTTPTPAPAVRRGRPGYDRQTLVDLCVKAFNRHGYDATSMGMLATELGISNRRFTTTSRPKKRSCKARSPRRSVG